jgi:hypothetical protein
MNLKEHIEKFDELHPESVEIDYTEKLFAPVEKLETDIQDRDKIIQNLKKDITELMNQISIIEKEKSVISEELKKSGWLENKVTLSTKKVYEGKIKTIIGEIKVVDSKIIPILTTVGRKKQGNQQLNWVNWLKIPENKYLFHVNDGIAKGIFEETNTLIKRRFEDENPSRGGGVGYSLTFSGNGTDAGKTYVSTDFNPDTYNLNLGCTFSYWVRPDEIGNTMFAFGRKHNNSQRFSFGIYRKRQSYFGMGPSRGIEEWDDMDTPVEESLLVPQGSYRNLKTDGTWYHFVATYDDRPDTSSGADRKIYVNGVLRQTDSFNWSSTGGSTGGMYFGARNVTTIGYDNGWACGLEEVAIYDTAKNSDWVNEVYNGKTGYDHRSNSGIVGYWKFDEGFGTTAKDLSGNGNHGTLTTDDTGLPVWSNDKPT